MPKRDKQKKKGCRLPPAVACGIRLCMQQKIKDALQKDMSRRAFWALVGLAVLAKLVLVHFQCIYTWIDGAPLDDELMFKAAQSITAGRWLGPYNWLTLSKHMFFPVWLSMAHALRVPYLLAGQLLLCAAALAAALAFAPVLSRYKSRFLLFALLAYNPAATAGFTLRVYRDNIFPAECLLFFAGLIGYALRYVRPLKQGLPWLGLCGLGLALAWLTREDGVWLLPFLLAGCAALLFAVLRQKGLAHKARRCAALTLPAVVLALAVNLFCAVNYAWYGVYTVSDFSSGSFAEAFGAMTRVEHQNWHPLVGVPRDVREKLYQTVEELAPFRYWLEEYPPMRNGYLNKALGDYQTGSFYWVLRRTAQEEGVYKDAPTAQAFWQRVADKINALCDAGVLPAERGRRSTTTPPIRAGYLPDVLAEGARGLWYTMTFQDCEASLSEITIGQPQDVAVWEEYLGSRANLAAIAGTADPYYSPLQELAFRILHWVRCLYALALPPALLAAVWVQMRLGWGLVRRGKQGGAAQTNSAKAQNAAPLQTAALAQDTAQNKAAPQEGAQETALSWLLWLILAGVLGMVLLRCLMIAFVEVASFNIGTYVMYLSTVHPLLILFAAAGLLTAWPQNLPGKGDGRP